MIKINVADIMKSLVGSKELAYEVTPEELEISSKDLEVVGPVRFTGTITNAGDVLLLQGKVTATVKRVCGRCLEEFTATSTAEVLEKYYPAGTVATEADALVYEGDLVDVAAALRESLVLAEPLQVLCKEDCKGLCPVCGANRNLHPCTCDTTRLDPRFSALKELLKK